MAQGNDVAGGRWRSETAEGRYALVGDGPLLVCLPGGPGFPGRHLRDLGGLSTTRTLLLPDMRGAGESPPPLNGRFGVSDYVEDVEQLRRHLGLDRFDLFGHSFGGLVAATYAARYPEHTGVVVLDGTPLATELIAIPAEGLQGFFANYDAATSGYAEELETMLYEPAVDWFVRQEYEQVDLREVLPKIPARTLVITGDRDWACGTELARAMAGLLPNGELAVVSGAGHFAWVERPAEYASSVATFLGSTRTPNHSHPTP